MKNIRIVCSVLMFLVLASCHANRQDATNDKPRVIVTCDPELDDNNSLIRYVLYSSGFDTEGIIYASSQFHWKGDGKGTTQYIPGREYARPDRDLGPQTSWRWAEGERFIDDIIEAYEKVYPNLKVHDPNYPTPDHLKSLIRVGNVEFEGDISHDSPGSDLIKQVLLDDDSRPVFIQVWGGPSTASRALKSIQEEYEGTPEWEAIRARVSAKAKFCLSGHQDQTYKEYVQVYWPQVESVSFDIGVANLGYGARNAVPNIKDTIYFSAAWTSEMIKSQGILGDMYRVWGDGKQMSKDDFTDYFGLSGYSAQELISMGYWVWTPPQPYGNFISEGDTPCYLNLIDNGLRAHESQEYGGWAGRRKSNSDHVDILDFSNQFIFDTMDSMSHKSDNHPEYPDYIPAIQNDFAARMAWSATSEFSAVNHNPVITGPYALDASAGETIKIRTRVKDPDRDSMVFSWTQHKVGSHNGEVRIEGADSMSPSVKIPSDAKSGDVFHLIMTAEDNGQPSLVRYHRTVITVR